MPIIPMRKEHLSIVAKLHRESIVGLIAQLGQRFCERLYWGMANTPFSFVLVYEDGGEVLGFICGTTHASKMYRHVLRRRAVSLGWAAAGRLLRPGMLRRALISLRRPKTFTSGDYVEWDLPEAELVAIGVQAAAQGKRIGAQLVNALFERLRARGCERVRVHTDEENKAAVRFYEKCGFRLLGMRPHHSGQIHVLVADLGNKSSVTT